MIDLDTYYLENYNAELEKIKKKYTDFVNENPELKERKSINDFQSINMKNYEKYFVYKEKHSTHESYTVYENQLLIEINDKIDSLDRSYNTSPIKNYFKYEFENVLKSIVQKQNEQTEDQRLKVPNIDLIYKPDFEKIIALVAKIKAMFDFHKNLEKSYQLNRTDSNKKDSSQKPTVFESTLVMYYIVKDLNYDFEKRGNKIKITRLIHFLTEYSEKSIEKIISNPLIDKDKNDIKEERIDRIIKKLKELGFENAANLLMQDKKK